MRDSNTTLEQLKKIHAKFISERGWHKYQDPKSVALSICIEAAELVENFQWDTRAQGVKKLNDPKWLSRIKSEVADVFIYLIDFANHTGIDLAEAFEEKMAHNRVKFPVNIGSGLKKYHKIKEEYRKEKS